MELGAAANYMTPYTYTLPQSAGIQAAVAAANGILSPYQPGATLQEARLQWFPNRIMFWKM